MKGKNKKYVNLFLLLLITLLMSSMVFSEDRDGGTRIKEGKPVSVFNNKEELLKNQIEIESGDFEVLGYKGEGKLLALDYKTLEYQNNALDRISTFVESLMWHEYIVTNPADQTDYGAHDLKSKDIARFFNKAVAENKPLKPEEIELKDLLIERNIIKTEPDGTYSGFDNKAVIGVFHYDDEGEYDSGYRKATVWHEMEHGKDYTDTRRLEETKAVWDRLDENEKSAFKKFLLAIGDYNTFDPDLEATEFRAYSNTEGGGKDLINLLKKQNEAGEITNQEMELLKRFAINTPEGKEFWTASISPTEEVPETLQEVEEEPTEEEIRQQYKDVDNKITDPGIDYLKENGISAEQYKQLHDNNVDVLDIMVYHGLNEKSHDKMIKYENEYGDGFVRTSVLSNIQNIGKIGELKAAGMSKDYIETARTVNKVIGFENLMKLYREAGVTSEEELQKIGEIKDFEAFVQERTKEKPKIKPEEKPQINTFDTNGDGAIDKLTIAGNDYILDQSSKLFLQSGKEDIAVDMDGNIYELNFYSEMYELKSDPSIAIDAYNGEQYKLDSKSGFYINEEYPDKAIDPSTGDLYYKEGNLFVHQSEWYAFNPETNEFYVYDYIEGKWVLWEEYYKEEPIKVKPEVKPEEKLDYPSGWTDTEHFTSEEANAWREKRIDASLALEWKNRGFTPDQAEQWIKAGVYSPAEAKRLSDEGKTPQQFQEERMELFKEKLDTNYIYWAGILGITTIEDLQKLYDAGITLEQLKAHKGRIENVDDFIASLKREETPKIEPEEKLEVAPTLEEEIKIFYNGDSITLTNPDSDETGTYYEGKTADGRDVRYYTTGDNIGKLFEIEVTQTKYFYKIDDKQKIELRYSDDEENYIGIDDKGNKYAYYPDTDKLKRTNKVGYTETIEAKVEEIKGGKKIIKNLLATGLEIKTNEQIKQEIARIEAEQRRRDVARFMGAILYPTAGALQLQELFDKHLGDDITWFRTKDWRKWGKLGYIDSAIEGLMCDAFHMIGEGPSDIFIKDYPGHYVGGNDLPNLGSILVVNGVRTEYETADWDVENCNFKPKWFPLKEDDEIKELGYLYKIHWYIRNPYSEKEVGAMSRSERKRLGLDEFEGNISYRIIMKGKACSSYELPSSYKMPSPRYFNLGPGQEHNYNFAYYDLAYMDKICIEFRDWKYNGKDKNYPKNCDKEIKISSLKAEADFVYLPEGTTAAGTLPGRFTPLTSDKSTTGKTKIDCPPALCGLLS